LLQRPDAVVSDDAENANTVTGERVELHPGEPEGAVAEQQHNRAVGTRELGAERVAGTRPEAAVWPRIKPTAGLVGVDDPPGERDEVTAVADHDRVAREHLRQLAVDPHRVKRHTI